MLELLNKIHELDEKQLVVFTQELLDKCNLIAQNEQVVGMSFSKLNKGFIGYNTKLSYGSSYGYYYGMNDFSMYYDFFKQIKNSTISDLNDLLKEIFIYLNKFFGSEENNNSAKGRDDLITNILLEDESISDEEYLNMKNNLQISVFKNKGVAMCSERTALAQNLLSLLDIESYYCSGVIKNSLEADCGEHAFNVIKNDDKYYVIDFSVPVKVMKNGKIWGCAPYAAHIDNEKITDLMDNKYALEFFDYYYDISSGKLEKNFNDDVRLYGIGLLSYDVTENRIRR